MRLAGNLRVELLVGFLLKGAGAVSSFGLTWLIARAFGATTVGLFQIALATANFAVILAGQGLDRVLVRLVSVSLSHDRSGEAAAYFRTAAKRTFLAGGLIAILVFLVADPFATRLLNEPRAAVFLQTFAPVILALTLIRLCASLLRSNGDILISQSLDGVSYTTFAFCAVGAAYWAAGVDWPLFPALAYLAGAFIVVLYALYRSRSLMAGWGSPQSVRLPTSAGLYVTAFVGMASVSDWLGLMVLTSAEGAASAGIYRTAFQICMLFTIVNASFATMVGPRIAAAGARRDVAAINQANRTASLLGTLICLPLFLLVMWRPDFVLGLFGPEFTAGADALRILAVGQLVNVAFGPMGASLTMMSRERAVFLIELVATLGALAIIVAGVPVYGMVAIAVASAVASFSRNALSWLALRRELRAIETAG